MSRRLEQKRGKMRQQHTHTQKDATVQVFKCGVVSCDVPTGREDEEEEKILVFSTFLFRKRGRVLSDDRFPVTLTLLGGKDEK